MADEIRNDVEGYDWVTQAIRTLINTYPGLEDGQKFGFSQIPSTEGISIFPSTGSAIQSEIESITGHVTQLCLYPFTTMYKASGLSQATKVNVKEWLDNFGRWLEKQPVKIGSTTYTLDSYPVLQGTREIREISRQTPAYLSTINDDKSEEWLMDVTVRYRNEFDK